MKRDENTPLTTGKSPMAWGSIPLLCPAVVSDFTTPERLGGSNRHLTIARPHHLHLHSSKKSALLPVPFAVGSSARLR